MTHSEFYTRARDIIEDYITYLPIENDIHAYYGGVAAHIGVILVECSTYHLPPKEFLHILRHNYSYYTPYKSPIKGAYRYFYRTFKKLSLDLDHTLSDTVEALRHQGFNTYE